VSAILKVKTCLGLLLIFTITESKSQHISSFKQNGKWGFKKGDLVILDPQFDTTFGFDVTNRIALVGKIDRTKKTINPLTKEIKLEYKYYYITPENKRIYIKRSETDSIVDVSISKQTPSGYLNNNNAFIAFAGGKKYLMSKTGQTISHIGFDNINFTKVQNYYTTETKELKNNQTLVGLMKEDGTYVIQQMYSKIIINPFDSVIYCCTAGIKFNGSDDVFNYKGSKIHSSAKHIHFASKSFVIYKLYESENSFIVYNLVSEKEKPLKAEWIYYLKNETMVLLDGDWYFYDLKTEKRFPIDKKLIKYYNLND